MNRDSSQQLQMECIAKMEKYKRELVLCQRELSSLKDKMVSNLKITISSPKI